MQATRVISLMFLCIACTFVASKCKERRTPEVYEIPSTFRGEVEIEFERPECPPLEIRETKRIFKVPTSGMVCTSSSMQTGWSRDEFWLVDDRGGRQAITENPGKAQMIWGASGATEMESNKRKPRHFERFFVGTEIEYRAAAAEAQREGRSL
jgi:hypothetical protein